MANLITPENAKTLFRVGKNWSKRNSTKLLTAGTIVSIFGTGYAAWKARPYADRALERAEEEKGEKLTFKEKLKVVAPYYIPAGLTALSGTVCVISAEVKNGKRADALAGAYGFSSAVYQAFRKGVDEKFGEGSAKSVDDILHSDDKVVLHGDGFSIEEGLGSRDTKTVIFIDAFSRRKFESTIGRIQDAQIAMMNLFQTDGEVGMKDWYKFIGIYDQFSEASKEIIDELGWTYDGQVELNAVPGWHPCHTEEGDGCIILEMNTPPYPLYCTLDDDLYADIKPALKTHLDEI